MTTQPGKRLASDLDALRAAHEAYLELLATVQRAIGPTDRVNPQREFANNR